MKPIILLMSCEHAVNTVPSSYRHLFHQKESVLETHRGVDFGALHIAMHVSQALECYHIQAMITRLLIDCNRSLNHPQCYSEFSSSLSHIEKQKLIDHYYLPYRQQIGSFIQRHIDEGNQVFHISSHSFTPVFNGVIRNAGIGLLYDPRRHGEKEVAREWKGLLTQETDYRIRLNYPYSGRSDGLTTDLRKKHSEKDYLGLELEVNQALTQDPTALEAVTQSLIWSIGELLALL
jgi:predicted N-formylglutamate amidohydrolase